MILRDARASDPAKGIQRAHVRAAFTAQRITEIIGATWNQTSDMLARAILDSIGPCLGSCESAMSRG
jgi:hypothetical protein